MKPAVFKSSAKLLLILFIIFSFSIPVLPQPLNDNLNKFINEYILNKNIPSVSAGAAVNGKIIWIGTAGFSDVENFVPASPSTLYRIASISKAVTAVAIMQLVEKDKIKLDDDVRKYVTFFPQKKWKFTIRQLLNHTSGIRGYKEGEFDSKEFFRTTRDAVNYIAKDSLQFEPGTKYLYTTLGYNLLAAVIEKVSRLTFSEYLDQNIFIPSGMTSTINDVQKKIILNRAKGYVKNEYRILENAPLADLSIKYPGGGLLSTSEDLLKFSLSLTGGKLINLSILDTMLVPTVLKNKDTLTYGLGFDIKKDEKGRFYFAHAGGGTGFISLLLIYPKEKISAVHLVNIRDRGLESPAMSLSKIILDKIYLSPEISIADKMLEITLNRNVDSAIVFYKKIKADSLNNQDYNSNPDELNLFGHDLISIKRYAEAIKFYKFFIAENKEYVKAYIGLADAYNADGNRGLSLKTFRTVLRLDPANSYASYMVKKLEGN